MTLNDFQQAYPMKPKLAGLIDGYFQFSHNYGESIYKNILPCPHVSVVFSYSPIRINGALASNILVIGMHENIHQIECVNGDINCFIIRFASAGCFRFTATPVSSITENVLTGREVFGPSIEELFIATRNAANFFQRAKLADVFFENQLRSADQVDDDISRIAELIKREPEVSIKTLQVEMDWAIGSRQMARRFKKSVGVNLQTYIRFCRFEMAKRIFLQDDTGLPLTSVGYRSGYYDQAHFSKEFKKLSGYNPKSFLPACSLQPVAKNAENKSSMSF